jgi:hypothetical protein
VTILLAAVFTYLAVRGVNWHRAWRALQRCDAWWLLPGMVAFAVQTVLRAMRWRSLFAHARRPARGPVLAATMIGYLFNNIMPARAGEAARVVALSQRTPTPAAEIVGTVVVERAYDVLAVLIIFFCASPWLPHESWFTAAAILAGVAAAGLGVVIWVLAVHGDRPLRFIVRPLARLPGLSAQRVEREAATRGARGAAVEPCRVDDLSVVGMVRAARVRALARIRRRRAGGRRDRARDDHPVAARRRRGVRGRRCARPARLRCSGERRVALRARVARLKLRPLRSRRRDHLALHGPSTRPSASESDLYLIGPRPDGALVQEMVIYGVSFDMVGKQPIVLLKTADGNKFLPIWIGHPEAASILMKLQGATTPRPMTHDLLCDVLGELDVRCTQVAVTELRDNTFFAQITLQVAGRELEIDSRPSDAIALAVRVGAPIFAAEEVIADSAIEFEHEVEDTDDVVEKFKEFLDQVTPEDFAAGDS